MNYDIKPRCDECGKYSGYDCDVGIRYGCKYDYDGEISPLDQENWCIKCAKKKEKEFEDEIIKNGEGKFNFCNWWERPLFTKIALEKTGYKMVRSDDNSHFILSKI